MARLKSIEGVWLPADNASREELKGLIEVDVVPAEKAMTAKQRSSIHVYLRQVMTALNNAGLDMRKVLKPGVEIPWTEYAAKEFLWRPIQKAMTGKESTTALKTVDPSEVHQVLDKHLSEKFSVSFPWPSKQPPMMGD